MVSVQAKGGVGNWQPEPSLPFKGFLSGFVGAGQPPDHQVMGPGESGCRSKQARSRCTILARVMIQAKRGVGIGILPSKEISGIWYSPLPSVGRSQTGPEKEDWHTL